MHVGKRSTKLSFYLRVDDLVIFRWQIAGSAEAHEPVSVQRDSGVIDSVRRSSNSWSTHLFWEYDCCSSTAHTAKFTALNNVVMLQLNVKNGLSRHERYSAWCVNDVWYSGFLSRHAWWKPDLLHDRNIVQICRIQISLSCGEINDWPALSVWWPHWFISDHQLQLFHINKWEFWRITNHNNQFTKSVCSFKSRLCFTSQEPFVPWHALSDFPLAPLLRRIPAAVWSAFPLPWW